MKSVFIYFHLLLGLTTNGQPPVSWVRQYISGNNPAFDFANDMAVDAPGNVYLTGSSYGSNQLPDAVTIKYTSYGATSWVRRFDGTDNNWDDAKAVYVDVAGNVYITGETYSNNSFFDFLTIKYDAAGNQLWVATFNGPSNNDDGAEAIVVDAAGNVYVTGHSWQSGTSWDYLTIKYNSSGQQLWVERFNGPGNSGDFAIGIGLDASANIYVGGTTDDLAVNNIPAYTTIKYNSNGVMQWVNSYKDLWTYAADFAVDAAGNSYVTGHSYSSQGDFYDYATVKYSSSGAQQWVRRYDGPGSSDDYAKAITVDLSGNVYVTGEAFFTSNNGADYATIKYSASGVQQWVAQYNGPGNAVDVGTAIVTDAAGYVYVTGESRGANGDDDYGTVKYNAAGVEQWNLRYTSPGNEIYDLASGIGLDAIGGIYVTGRSNQVGSSVITTIRYGPAQAPLPLKLIQFNAEYINGATTLRWTTLSETSTDHFEVQRGSNGREFNTIGNVRAAGNSTTLKQYMFEDSAPLPGINFYRLRIIDADGKAEYSNIVRITSDAAGSFAVFPNPVADKTLMLQLNGLPKGIFTLELFNSAGQTVYRTGMIYPGGYVTASFKLPQWLGTGLYHLHIISGDLRLDQKLILK